MSMERNIIANVKLENETQLARPRTPLNENSTFQEHFPYPLLNGLFYFFHAHMLSQCLF